MTLLGDVTVWTTACPYDRLLPNRGVGVLLPDGVQAALFRLDDGSLRAVGNIDPFSGAAVMSRGIVGDLVFVQAFGNGAEKARAYGKVISLDHVGAHRLGQIFPPVGPGGIDRDIGQFLKKRRYHLGIVAFSGKLLDRVAHEIAIPGFVHLGAPVTHRAIDRCAFSGPKAYPHARGEVANPDPGIPACGDNTGPTFLGLKQGFQVAHGLGATGGLQITAESEKHQQHGDGIEIDVFAAPERGQRRISVCGESGDGN